MSLSITLSRAKVGINSPIVRIEIHLSGGLPAFNIVGLVEASTKESKERVRSAIINSELKFPSATKENAEEASLAKDLKIITCENLQEIFEKFINNNFIFYQSKGLLRYQESNLDISDIQGQEIGKRALLIAAAGSHNFLLKGPPSTGKTLLASRLASILPPLTEQEALEVVAIHSLNQIQDIKTFPQRPFQTPHHSSSLVALVGGGSKISPGEISLAHNGVFIFR